MSSMDGHRRSTAANETDTLNCSLLAALPAAKCSPLRNALLRWDCLGSPAAEETADDCASRQKDRERLSMQCRAHLRDTVWCGISMPIRAVPRQVNEPGLRQALVRAGRGRAVLHRTQRRQRQSKILRSP